MRNIKITNFKHRNGRATIINNTDANVEIDNVESVNVEYGYLDGIPLKDLDTLHQATKSLPEEVHTLKQELRAIPSDRYQAREDTILNSKLCASLSNLASIATVFQFLKEMFKQ
ncbi:hypothetical protein [Pantoea ananatis]|uniref:hypothetical protein n=1 Tax=Pantoea ananas TaxID=553 RepID=UPI00049652A2|nr:hypothetical protein [Pantoea ananatis]